MGGAAVHEVDGFNLPTAAIGTVKIIAIAALGKSLRLSITDCKYRWVSA
jgi:hypothetical protein